MAYECPELQGAHAEKLAPTKGFLRLLRDPNRSEDNLYWRGRRQTLDLSFQRTKARRYHKKGLPLTRLAGLTGTPRTFCNSFPWACVAMHACPTTPTITYSVPGAWRGHWPTCDSFMPRNVSMMAGHASVRCLVYSFGIADEWGFDDVCSPVSIPEPLAHAMPSCVLPACF